MQDHRTETILVVDDSEINRAVLANIFSPFYHIEEAENGQEAMDKLLTRQDSGICAVLLDVIMPVMDGMEVLRRMQALGWMERIPVFLITADAEDRTLREA